MGHRIVLLFLVVAHLSTASGQSQQSDALFARGVKYYHAGKYKKAIPLFSHCDSLDRAEMDSANSRRLYASHWLSSSHFLLGDTMTAQKLDVAYRCRPVDRRLTVESDSLSDLGSLFFQRQQYDSAYYYFDRCRQIETSVIGEFHYFMANSLSAMAQCRLAQGDTLQAAQLHRERVEMLEATKGIPAQWLFSAYFDASYVSYWSGDCLAASQYMEKAKNTRRSLGTDNDDYLRLLSDQDYFLRQQKNWLAAAENKGEQAAILGRMHGLNSQQYIAALNTCGVYYYRAADYTSAVSYTKKALLRTEENGQLDSKEGLLYMNNLRSAYIKLDSIPAAISLLEKIIPVSRRIEGYAASANQLMALSNYYRGTWQFDKALHYALECRNDMHHLPQMDSLSYAQLLTDIGRYQNRTGAYADALHTDSIALGIYARHEGENGEKTLMVLNNIAVVFANQKRLDESILLAEDVMERRRLAFGENSIQYAFSLSNIANLYAETGNIQRGIELAEKAIPFYLRDYGDQHPETQNLYMNLSKMYVTEASNATNLLDGIKALSASDASLQYMELACGKQSEQYALRLHQVALCKYALEYYSLALGDLQQLQTIRSQLYGEYSEQYCNILYDLCNLCRTMRNGVLFTDYAEQNYEHCRRYYGEEHAKTAQAMMMLGDAYFYTPDGRFVKSEVLHREGLELTRRTAGTRSIQYADALMKYVDDPNVEDWTSAKQLAYTEEAVDIYREHYGNDSRKLISPLSTMAAYAAVACQFDKAAAVIEQIYNMKVQDSIKNRHDIILSGQNLCSCLYYSGQIDRIKRYAPVVQSEILQQVSGSFSTMTEYERENYWDTYKDWFNDQVLTLAHATDNDSLKIMAFDAQLVSKGLLLNTEISMQQYIKASGDSLLYKYLEHLNNMRYQLNVAQKQKSVNQEQVRQMEEEIAHFGHLWMTQKAAEKNVRDSLELKRLQLMSNLYRQQEDSVRVCLAQYKADIPDDYQTQTAALQRQVDDAERKLIVELSKRGYTIRLQQVTTQDVSDALPPASAAIEFVCFTDSSWVESSMQGEPLVKQRKSYYALVLKHGQQVPQLVYLFDHRRIGKHSIYTKERKTIRISVPADKYYTTDSLTCMIWHPLRDILSDITTVYFTPVEELYRIAIENLPGTEQWRLHRLSSSRELVTHRRDDNHENIVLYGGIKYEYSPNELHTLPQNDISAVTFRDVPQLRGAVSTVAELPGSLREVEVISRQLQEQQIHVKSLTRTDGTEESFKQLSGQAVNILHISTHGFYETGRDVATANLNRVVSVAEQQQLQRSEDRSLSKTGLLLAGASDYLKDGISPNATSTCEDGILTAKEVSQLDLSSVNIVVLSACETALGDITSDGVNGLQRGFKKAGANSILMSLWKVDDEATCLLMTEFYRNWIAEKNTKYDALEAAKHAVRSHKEKGWDDPKYWAAFILLDGLD